MPRRSSFFRLPMRAPKLARLSSSLARSRALFSLDSNGASLMGRGNALVLGASSRERDSWTRRLHVSPDDEHEADPGE